MRIVALIQPGQKMTVTDNPMTHAFKRGAIKGARQTMAAGMALGLIDFAAARGADRGVLLAMAGLRVDADPNQRVALDRYAAMLREAARQCRDPALAVHFAEATNFADLSIVGLLGYASETMRDALDQLNRYGRLVTDLAVRGGNRFVLTPEADGLWLADCRIDSPPFPELTESTFVRMVAGTRQFGDTPFVSLAEVTHPAGPSAPEFERALGVPVRFGAPRNALRVSQAWQEYRIALYPRYAFALFCADGDRLLSQLAAEESLSGRVERAIVPLLHTGTISAARIAAQLGLSPQGLYRGLRAEEQSFEALYADVRHRFAKGYLKQGRASLKEIAYLLGYSEVSAFARAFKRREGVSLGAYRDRFSG